LKWAEKQANQRFFTTGSDKDKYEKMSGEGTLRYEVKVHEEKDDHLLKT
jgi:hypothetical protein